MTYVNLICSRVCLPFLEGICIWKSRLLPEPCHLCHQPSELKLFISLNLKVDISRNYCLWENSRIIQGSQEISLYIKRFTSVTPREKRAGEGERECSEEKNQLTTWKVAETGRGWKRKTREIPTRSAGCLRMTIHATVFEGLCVCVAVIENPWSSFGLFSSSVLHGRRLFCFCCC